MENQGKTQVAIEKVDHKTLLEALAAVTREITPISKERKNAQQGFMYRGIEDFINEIHNLYAKHGILVFVEELENSEVERTTKSNTLMFYPKARIKFTFVHESGEGSRDVIITGSASDAGDKGLNKCYSIAYKYALTFLHNVPTDVLNDPDATTPPENSPRNGSNQKGEKVPHASKRTVAYGTKDYHDLVKWLKADPKHTIDKIKANYIIDNATLSQLEKESKQPTQ